MAERPNVALRLAERDALAKLPAGSLGRAYLAFVTREKISAEGIRSASEKGRMTEETLPPQLEWVRKRMRDTHDLWHAVTGYSGDVIGETALLAFTFAQTWNPAVGLIIAIGLQKTWREEHGGAGARKTILDGFRRGLSAAWLPEQDWEAMLDLPLDQVRRRLSLGAPPVYQEIRSATLKAAPAA